MPNQLLLIFSADEIQRLLDVRPYKIVVRSVIEAATLTDGSAAGVVKVYADAMERGNPTPLLTVTGCPDPPCTIDE